MSPGELVAVTRFLSLRHNPDDKWNGSVHPRCLGLNWLSWHPAAAPVVFAVSENTGLGGGSTTVLDCQEQLPSTCSFFSLPSFPFFPCVFTSRRPSFHSSFWASGVFPSSKSSGFLCFPLLANSSPITLGSADWLAQTTMSISSDLSYQPSSRLGKKIMNSSSFFFFPPVHRSAIPLPFC